MELYNNLADILGPVLAARLRPALPVPVTDPGMSSNGQGPDLSYLFNNPSQPVTPPPGLMAPPMPAPAPDYGFGGVGPALQSAIGPAPQVHDQAWYANDYEKQVAAAKALADAAVVPKKTASVFGKNDGWVMALGALASYFGGGHDKGQSVQDFLKTYAGIKGQHAEDLNAQYNAEDAASTEADKKKMQAIGLGMSADKDMLDNLRNEREFNLNQDYHNEALKVRELKIKGQQLFDMADMAIKGKDPVALQAAGAQIAAFMHNPDYKFADPADSYAARYWKGQIDSQVEGINLKKSQEAVNAAKLPLMDAQTKQIAENTRKLGFEADIKDWDHRFQVETYDDKVAQEASKTAMATAKLTTEKLKQGKLTADTAGAWARTTYTRLRAIGVEHAQDMSKAGEGDFKSQVKLQGIAQRSLNALNRERDNLIKLYGGGTLTPKIQGQLDDLEERINAAQDYKDSLEEALARKAASDPSAHPTPNPSGKIGAGATLGGAAGLSGHGFSQLNPDAAAGQNDLIKFLNSPYPKRKNAPAKKKGK